MIDWHSHVLPNMDDGSSSPEESVVMLKMLSDQNVDYVIATPHFIANDESVEVFLQRRKESFESLCNITQDKLPNIILGAEVKYYNGISRMENLEELCIEGTSSLLLEMPFGKWTEYTVRELEEIATTKSITVILAHIERYFSKNSVNVFKRLYRSGILMQVNANCFDTFFARKKAYKLPECEAIRFIGTDCHNTTTRQPNIKKSFELLQKKFGKAFIDQFNQYGLSVLFKNSL